MTSFDLPGPVAELTEAAARFAGRELAAGVRAAEESGHWPEETVAVVRDFSLSGLDLPERLGGAGLGSLAKVVLLETLAVGDPGALPSVDQPGPAIGALLACPDTSLAADVAAACLAGEAQAPLVVDGADGSDADTGAVRRQARLEWAPAWPPIRWVWWLHDDTLRLLSAGDGITPVAALGFRASGGAGAPLDRWPVVGEWALSAHNAVGVRGRARLWSAAVAVGIGQAAFDATIAYTTERVVFGKPVAHHQGNAFELAVAATRLHGARLMVRDAAARFDAGDDEAGYWATQAWLETVDGAFAVTDLGIQLLGGHGFLVDHLAEKRFREARMLALLFGGRDAAEADVAAMTLDIAGSPFAEVPA